jgi:hypothetical protein
MNNSFERLIDGMTVTLRNEVLTRLDDEFARGQVFGIINLLNNMRLRADWSVNFLQQEVNAQREAFAKVEATLASSGQKPPTFGSVCANTASLAPALDAPALIKMREEGNQALIELLRWLWSDPQGVSQEQKACIEVALRRAMRSEVEVELKHLAKPMFAEMSQGSEETNS